MLQANVKFYFKIIFPNEAYNITQQIFSVFVYVFLGSDYCIPKRWPMGPLQQSLPPVAQTCSYATVHDLSLIKSMTYHPWFKLLCVFLQLSNYCRRFSNISEVRSNWYIRCSSSAGARGGSTYPKVLIFRKSGKIPENSGKIRHRYFVACKLNWIK